MSLSKVPVRAIDGNLVPPDNSITGPKIYSKLYALPQNPSVDLREFMDIVYPGGWTQRTAAGVGSDAGPAMDAAFDALRTKYGRGELIIPPGSWLVNTAPTPSKLAGHKIRGYGSQASQLTLNHNSAVLLDFNAAGFYTGGGAEGLALLIEDGLPSSLSRALRLQGDTVTQPDQSFFRDLYITVRGNSYWYENLVAEGRARTSPQGIRVGRMEAIECFGARNYAVGFYNLVQWIIDDLGTYAGTGALANYMLVSGNGTTGTNTAQVDFRRLAIGGQLNITNCRDIYLNGFCSELATDTSAQYVNGWMRAPSFVGAFNANCNVIVRN